MAGKFTDASTRHDRYWQAIGTNERRWAAMDRRNARRREALDQLRAAAVERCEGVECLRDAWSDEACRQAAFRGVQIRG